MSAIWFLGGAPCQSFCTKSCRPMEPSTVHEAASSMAEEHLSDPRRAVHQYKVVPGSEISLKGPVQLKR